MGWQFILIHVLPWSQLAGAVIFGMAISWWFARARIHHAAEQARSDSKAEIAILTAEVTSRDASLHGLHELQAELTNLRAREASLNATLDQERQRGAERLQDFETAEKRLSEVFKALSSDALKTNNESFLREAQASLEKYQQSAKHDLQNRQQAIDMLVKPLKKSLESVDQQLKEVEKRRIEDYTGLTEQVKMMKETHGDLRSETSNLVRALRQPTVRGRWGEIQLKRVVEMAGMLSHCDFEEQKSKDTGDGRVLRPDLVVQLPGKKNVVVDAKAPLTAFLAAIDATDEDERVAKMKEHAKLVRTHVKNLSKKSYFDQFDPTPEFVVLFLPGEVFFSAALEHDPSLIEAGVEQNIIVATPTTLIALLRAVAYGWRQEGLAENAKQISDLGRDLYKRLAQMGEHFTKMGKNLKGATEAYNRAVGSLEQRVFPSARKFEDLHVTTSADCMQPMVSVEQTPRELQVAEYQQDAADAGQSDAA